MNTEQRIRISLKAEGERLPNPGDLAVAEPDRGRRASTGPLAALGALVAVLLIVGVTAFATRGQNPVEVVAPPTTTTTSPTTTSTGLGTANMIPVELGLDLVFYPTLLPDDLTLCQEVDNPPTMSVTACSSDVRSFSVGVRQSEFPELGGEPVSDHVGWTVIREDDSITVEIPVAESWRLRATAKGLTEDEVLATVSSIPVIGDRESFISDYEIPFVFADLEDDQLSSIILGTGDSRVVRGRDDSITLVGETVDGNDFTLHSSAATPADLLNVISGGIGSATLVDNADRPMIIGDLRTGRVAVYWVQREKLWALLSQGSRESVAALAIDASTAIAALPPRTRNWQVEFLRTTQPVVNRGEQITVEGQLSGPFPEGLIQIYLLSADPLDLVDYLCRDNPGNDGVFACTGAPLGEGGGFGPIVSGEYILAIDQPWFVVPGSNFRIVDPDE